MRTIGALSLLLLLATAAAPQSVISVRAGLVNAAEGAVFVNGQPLSQKFGTYPALHEGSDLYTQDGRAELQLAPNVFLRVGMNSAVRMVSSSLQDTQLRILNGSVIFDSGNAPSPGTVTLLAVDASILIEAPSRMRIDAEPPQIRIEKGAARVTRGGAETVVRMDQMMPLAGESVVKRVTGTNDDALEMWSLERNRAIYLSLATSQSLTDPGTDTDTTADLGDYLGYMPYSGVLPVTGIYATQPPAGYTYPYPYLYAYGYGYMPYYSRPYIGGIGPSGYSALYLRSITAFRPAYGSTTTTRPPMFAPRPVITTRPVAPRPVLGAHPVVHR